MDTRITLRFDEATVNKAKRYAEKNNISLSRLVEFLLQKTISGQYTSLEDLPISDWVNQVSEGTAVYNTKKKNRKSTKAEYFSSRK
jgi:antitoxin component of RelBE/YafQ-DinJ toxin-antitoxin module